MAGSEGGPAYGVASKYKLSLNHSGHRLSDGEGSVPPLKTTWLAFYARTASSTLLLPQHISPGTEESFGLCKNERRPPSEKQRKRWTLSSRHVAKRASCHSSVPLKVKRASASQSVGQSVILNPQQGSCSSRIRSNGFRWKPYHPPVIICGISKHDLDQTDQKSTSLACGTGPSLLEKHSARARARVCMCVWICMLTPPHLHKNQPIMAVWVNPSVHTAEVERRGRVGRGKDSQKISRGGRPFRWVMLLDPRGQFTTRRGKAGLSSRQNSAEADKNTRTHAHTHTHTHTKRISTRIFAQVTQPSPLVRGCGTPYR